MVTRAALAEKCLHSMLTKRLAVQDITGRFGRQYVAFLETNDPVTDPAKDDSPAYPFSLDMPLAERSFIMDILDNHPHEAVREGGRITYLAIFGSPSWEEEKKRLASMLAQERPYALKSNTQPTCVDLSVTITGSV